MTKCASAVELLLEFLEGNLPPEVRRRLMQHLQDCPPCLRFVDSYKKTSVLCRESLRRQVPPEVSERLMSFLRANASSPKRPQT